MSMKSSCGGDKLRGSAIARPRGCLGGQRTFRLCMWDILVGGWNWSWTLFPSFLYFDGDVIGVVGADLGN
jgi:hypothetical protein